MKTKKVTELSIEELERLLQEKKEEEARKKEEQIHGLVQELEGITSQLEELGQRKSEVLDRLSQLGWEKDPEKPTSPSNNRAKWVNLRDFPEGLTMGEFAKLAQISEASVWVGCRDGRYLFQTRHGKKFVTGYEPGYEARLKARWGIRD